MGRTDLCRAACVWSEIAQFQLGRLADALGNLQFRIGEAEFYELWESRGRSPEWQQTIDDMERPGIHGDWRAASAEYHFALLALAHVARAVEALDDRAVPQFRDSNLLRLLRNFNEHWEDPDGSSASRLRVERPGFETEPIQFTKKWLVFHEISDAELLEWLRAVEKSARKLLTSAHLPHPVWSDPLLPTSRDSSWTPPYPPTSDF